MTDDYVSIGSNKIATSSVASFYVIYMLFINRLRFILCKDNQNIFSRYNYDFRNVTYQIEPGRIKIHLCTNQMIEFYKGIYPSVVKEYDFGRSTLWCTVGIPFIKNNEINNLKEFVRYLDNFYSTAWLWLPYGHRIVWNGYNILWSYAPNHYLFESIEYVMSIHDKPRPSSRIECCNIHNCLDLYRELIARFIEKFM